MTLPNSIHNPNCDGIYCQFEQGEVRVLPLSSRSNLIVCQACYRWEIKWRKLQNLDYKQELYSLPTWESLEVYTGE